MGKTRIKLHHIQAQSLYDKFDHYVHLTCTKKKIIHAHFRKNSEVTKLNMIRLPIFRKTTVVHMENGLNRKSGPEKGVQKISQESKPTVMHQINQEKNEREEGTELDSRFWQITRI